MAWINNRICWSTVALGGLLIAMSGCGSEEPEAPVGPAKQGGPPPALVRVDLVKHQQVTQMRLVTGRLEPAEQSAVAAEEPGKVVTAPPDAGSFVSANQTLATLDTAILDRQRRVADAQLQTAKASRSEINARLAQASSQRKRLETLVSDGSVTQSDFDVAVRDEQVAKAQLSVAQTNIAMRQAELELIDERLAKMTIVAPFDGYITAKHTEQGQWLAAGSPAVTLMRINQVDAVLDVPEYILDQLADDSQIAVQVTGPNIARTGKVFKMVPNADRRTRTFPVEVRLDNADNLLRPGMSVRAELPIGKQVQAVTVPRDAVQTTPTGTIVYANRGGVAMPVTVHIQFKLDDRFVVDAPLGDGEQVIVEGNERVFPGQPLNVQNADQFAQSSAPAPAPGSSTEQQ